MAFFALTRVVASPWQIQTSQPYLVTKLQTRFWASTQVRTFISIRRSSNALVIYASEDPAVGYETKWKRKDGKTITVQLGERRLPDDDERKGVFPCSHELLSGPQVQRRERCYIQNERRKSR